jgi:hypothetical protein
VRTRIIGTVVATSDVAGGSRSPQVRCSSGPTRSEPRCPSRHEVWCRSSMPVRVGGSTRSTTPWSNTRAKTSAGASFRVAHGSRWGGVVLDPRLVESTVGRRLEMPAAFGADDAPSLFIVNALVEETVRTRRVRERPQERRAGLRGSQRGHCASDRVLHIVRPGHVLRVRREALMISTMCSRAAAPGRPPGRATSGRYAMPKAG